MGFCAVVLESDSRLAQYLASGLSAHFNPIHLTHSGDELREQVAGKRPEVVILDMEYSRLTDVRNLHHDFPSLPIVCTYRIPDEELWIAAMEAGASDVCPVDDVQNVLSSALRSVAFAKSAAA
jgi:DNA-binding NarL/FixJ family response regulator